MSAIPLESAEPFDSAQHYHRVRNKLIMYYSRRECYCAEELADETIERLVAGVHARPAGVQVEQWAYGIARHVHLEWLRKAARDLPLVDEGIAEGPMPRHERGGPDLKAAFQQLTPDETELLEAFYVDGLTAEQLGAKLGLSAEGVRSRIHRLRKKLLRSIEPDQELPGPPKRIDRLETDMNEGL
jgi:RNA polymerase sigma factor (sigma-70 family)